MILADAAQAVGGKLFILGGGWSIMGWPPGPSAMAIKLDVPWDQTNQRHQLRLALYDADGGVVTDEEGNGVVVEGDFEVGRPPGIKPGTAIDFSLAVGFPTLPLEPGKRYVWRLSIGPEEREDWQVSFSTAAPSTMQTS
jgi:hypothetical protein